MPLVIVFSESSDRLRRSRPRAPRTPCPRALPRNAAMGRRRKDPSSSANVEAAKRGDGDTSYCLVRAPRGGSSEVFRRPHPCDTLLAHASRSGLPTRAPHVRDRDPTRPHTHARRPHHPETCGCRGSLVRLARLLRPRTRGEREGFRPRVFEFLSERKRSDRDSVRSRRRPRGALAAVFVNGTSRKPHRQTKSHAHGGPNERRRGRLTTVLPSLLRRRAFPEWHSKKQNISKQSLAEL